jgi:hypothetical protein
MAIETGIQHAPGVRSQAVGPAGRMDFISRGRLRFALAFFWLLDGALQLQSYMFTKGFARDIIAPAGTGQPFFVADPVRWNAQLIAHNPALFNSVFAGVQLALGLGLLFRRTAKLAIVGSVVWAGGVWYLGEGLGGVVGGHMTALSGAPGAAVLYAGLSLAAWPADATAFGDRASDRPAWWTVYVWSVLWVGFAILNLLPANISSNDIGNQLRDSASTSPRWLASIDTTLAGGVHALGPGASLVCIVGEVAIGLLVLRGGATRTWAVGIGIAVTFLFWAAGQSFGQLFSGQATDPSTGPLLMALGLVVLCAPAGRLAAVPRKGPLASVIGRRQDVSVNTAGSGTRAEGSTHLTAFAAGSEQ